MELEFQDEYRIIRESYNGSGKEGFVPQVFCQGRCCHYRGGNRASCIVTLRTQASAMGVDMRLQTQAVSLLMKDPYTCTGLRAKTAGGKVIDFKARAVVLATGGMSTSKERLAEYTSIDLEKVIIDGPSSGQDGDGHKMVRGQVSNGPLDIIPCFQRSVKSDSYLVWEASGQN